MSISDPLLKELKATFHPFVGKKTISETDPELITFCESLERIFEKGIVLRNNEIPPPWAWLNAIAFEMERGNFPRIFSYIRSIEYVRVCDKVATSTGKFRLLIRCCLFYKCLHVPVEVMVRQVGTRRLNWYLPYSVLGHEVLGEILLSVLLQTSQLTFDLDISNARLLDLSWKIAPSVSTTFVPCPRLGLTISFIQNLAIVVRVEPSSVSAEDSKVEPGDVIDEVNEHVMSNEFRGRLKNILTKNHPITLRILKTNYDTPEKTHPALIRVLRVTPHLAADLGESIKKEDPRKMERNHGGYKVTYLGCCSVGNRGDVSVVEIGIRRVTASNVEPREVTLEFRELEVVISSQDAILLRHKFMTISACGRSVLFPKHFAYMVGNSECSSASEFVSHVFLADSEKACAAILLSLGYGFQRTHCAV